MKFELNEYTTQLSDEEILQDLQMVAKNYQRIIFLFLSIRLTENIHRQPFRDILEHGKMHLCRLG